MYLFPSPIFFCLVADVDRSVPPTVSHLLVLVGLLGAVVKVWVIFLM